METQAPVIGVRTSETFGKLIAALAAAQDAFSPITKNSENFSEGYKYADLAELIRATRPHLAQNGLAVIQSPAFVSDQGTVIVTTLLAHSSDEWIANELELPAGVEGVIDAKSIGAAITYARRYAYQSILNIAGEADDDTNLPSAKPSRNPGAAEPAHFMPVDYRLSRPITATERYNFIGALNEGKKTAEDVKAYFKRLGITRTEEMTAKDYEASIAWAKSPTCIFESIPPELPVEMKEVVA